MWPDDIDLHLPTEPGTIEDALDKLTVSGTMKLAEPDGVLNPTGQGGFSTVYQGVWTKAYAQDSSTEPVAIKIVRFPDQLRRKYGDRIPLYTLRESMLWSKLKHPNIVPFYGLCTSISGLGKLPHRAFVMPFYPAKSMEVYLYENTDINRMALIKNVVDGLQHLHSQGVVHGDLTVTNVLVDPQGKACLCDFGRSRLLHIAGFTATIAAGNMRFVAPELLSQEHAEEPINPDIKPEIMSPERDPPKSVTSDPHLDTDLNSEPMASKPILPKSVDSPVTAEPQSRETVLLGDENDKIRATYKSDIFSFAIVALEISSNSRAWLTKRSDAQITMAVMRKERPRRDSYPGVPEGLWKLLECCWCHDPRQRLGVEQVQEYCNTLV